MKQCTKCLDDKNNYEFRIRGNGYNSWCKQCQNEDSKKRYKPKPKKIKIIKSVEEIKLAAKKRMLKYRYGITYDEYIKMYNGKCDMCKKDFELGGYKGLFVDHNHDTNEVRGLLCRNCNTAIGLIYESKHIIQEAIKYLKINT